MKGYSIKNSGLLALLLVAPIPGIGQSTNPAGCQSCHIQVQSQSKSIEKSRAVKIPPSLLQAQQKQ